MSYQLSKKQTIKEVVKCGKDPTYIINNYASYRPEIMSKLWSLGYDDKDAEMRLMGSIPLQVAFCRLKYRRDKHAIPPNSDIEAQAKYWKRVYNTELGKGTVKHFMEANNA